MPPHARSCRRRRKAKTVFFPMVTGKKDELNCGFTFSPGAAVRGRLPICLRALESLYPPAEGKMDVMRPEKQRNVDDIQQAIALLRRHL